MRRFIHFHYRLYNRLLAVGLVVVLVSGLYASFSRPAEAETPRRASLFEPPALPKPTAPTKSLKQPRSPVAKPPVYNTAIAAPTSDLQALALTLSSARFGPTHWPALQQLWAKESNWNPLARNRSSGACGIPQAYPCSKIRDQSPRGQIEWGIDYIARRYGNPTNAWRHWQAHHWY